MKISELLTPALVKLNLVSRTKDELFEEMVQVFVDAGEIHDREEAIEVLTRREEQMSTGVGNGIGIPHGKLPAATHSLIALGISPEGIDYDARMDYCTKEMAQRICRHTLAKEAERRGIADPMMMNPATGSVSPLSDWVCDYMELTPEEWGGHYFSDAGLVEVRRTADGGWEEADIEARTAAMREVGHA